MMKKILSVIGCLVPFGAGAAVYPEDYTTLYPNWNDPGAGNSVGTDTSKATLTGINLGATDAGVNILSGNGITIRSDAGGNSQGLSVSQNFVVGAAATADAGLGSIHAKVGINPDTFVILSDGDINVGNRLQINEGFSLGIMSGKTINATFGTIDADGLFDVKNVAAFQVAGALTSTVGTNIAANTIDVGSLQLDGGETVLTATGALSVNNGNILNNVNAGDVTITASSATVTGDIQNNAGTMTFNLGAGSLTTASGGSIENTGLASRMEINAGDVIIAGTMKNDKTDANMVIKANSLRVNGGDAGYVGSPSLVNAGTFYATIDGNTHLEYGAKLDLMPRSNVFDLNTGTLTFGSGVNSNTLATMFTNNLGDANGNGGFKLTINNGDFDFGNDVRLVNGFVNGTVNNNAKMEVGARNVYVAGIRNYGTMNINATDTGIYPVAHDASSSYPFTGAGVIVAGDIVGEAGSNTTITSNADIIAETGVTNSGTSMVLNGVNIGLGAVASNQGAGKLDILAATSGDGMVYIDGNVATADGDVTIWGRDVKIGGKIVSTGGTTTVKSSDANNYDVQLELAGVDIDAGIVSLNSLVSDIYMTQGMSVTGGALNIGYAANETNLQHLLYVTGPVTIAGNVTASNVAATGNGDVNIAATSGMFGLVSEDSTINIDGDVVATADDAARTLLLSASNMTVGGDVTVANKGKIILGDPVRNRRPEAEEASVMPLIADLPDYDYQTVDVAGDMSATNGGQIDIYALDTTAGSLTVDAQSKLAMYGNQIVADKGNINVDGGVLFDGTDATTGMVINNDANIAGLQTTAMGTDIALRGGMTVGANRKLIVDSADDVTIAGAVVNKGTLDVDAAGDVTISNGDVTNTGVFDVNADSISMRDLTNSATANLTADGAVEMGILTSSGATTLKATTNVIASSIEATAGTLDIDANTVQADLFTVSGGITNLVANRLVVDGAMSVTGDVNQGGLNTGALNLANDGMSVIADSIAVSGKLNAVANSVNYSAFDGSVTISGGMDIDSGADVKVIALNNVSTADIVNDGTLFLQANGGTVTAGDLTTTGDVTVESMYGISLGAIRANGGNILLDSAKVGVAGDGRNYIDADLLEMNGAKLTLSGAGLNLAGAFTTTGILFQNSFSSLNTNDVNVIADDYNITTTNLAVAAIAQESGTLQVYTGDVKVTGDISATDLRFVTKPEFNYLDVFVGGDVSGNVDFLGLEHMKIAGDYKFNDNSAVNAVILGRNQTPYNYWATVSLADDLTLGDITNGENARPLIEVGGEFITEITTDVTAKDWVYGNGSDGMSLQNGQMGVTLFDIVDQGSAIWLLHADAGIHELATKIRNLNVNFCNADGSLCFNYLDAFDANNGAGEELPVYISVRDTNEDNEGDSLYIVFDPRFGGPVEVFKIQPIVDSVPGHTTGEYVSAGAIDDMIAGQLVNTGFHNRTPIEVIPLIFKGTNLETMANELYDRMEYYALKREEAIFVPFSRLFQVRELEQVMGALTLNEHTNFRSFEDRMFDEFIWNRNRNLKKAWLDVDFGMFMQDVTDGKRVDGNRFNVSGGFDWQESETLILGLTARMSHMSSSNSDTMDLAYLPNTSIPGFMSVDVADTNIGLGGYLMKILGNKTRVYGNAFLDLHMFDIDRRQTFMGDITGDGTAFALTTEWGLLHDWLNQYIVGNVYARLGYNFGVNITEKADGDEYMKLESDGYAILTPGYSLTAQKRIYPSAWFQIRPYATIGIEYDVLGAPDHAQYKFAPAHRFTDYDIDIDPMWANIGGGFEFISATGVQVGVDYRYQYNEAIRLHNIKVSGSYRF